MKITAALIPQAAQDLESAVARSGRGKTDIVNRAIILFAYVDAQLAAGRELLIRGRDGNLERIRLF